MLWTHLNIFGIRLCKPFRGGGGGGGGGFQYNDVVYQYRDTILKIRRSQYNMGIPIHGKDVAQVFNKNCLKCVHSSMHIWQCRVLQPSMDMKITISTSHHPIMMIITNHGIFRKHQYVLRLHVCQRTLSFCINILHLDIFLQEYSWWYTANRLYRLHATQQNLCP